MTNVTERFINRLFDLSYADFPDDILKFAENCFIDYLAATLGGFSVNSSKNLTFIKENQLSGKYHILGEPTKVDLHSAIMINAFNAHVLELDDSHRVAMTHLGAPIFSSLIGVAEEHKKSLIELYKAAVVGYEAAIRLANAIQPSHKKRGFHVSGTCCTVGAAMGIAAMLNYSKDEFHNTFSAAVTSAAGLLAVISGYSEQKPYNIANAAVAGVNAALYGKHFIGAVDILGDSRGFFHAMTDVVNEDKLFEPGYAITTIYQKLYAACRHCHAPMEAMLHMNADIDSIEKIEVYVYDLAIKGHDHTEIKGISSAKQSIPYGVAVACINKNCGTRSFTNKTVQNERILKLTKKVIVIEDPYLSSLVPEKRAARVIVYYQNGKTDMYQVDYPKGEPENPITPVEMKSKFYELTEAGDLNRTVADNLLNMIQDNPNNLINDLFLVLEGEE